jgi:hypothetical protein
MFFNMINGYSTEARKCLQHAQPGTPVNSPKYTKPGCELEHVEYLHVLKVANITNKAWTAAVIVAQHYNWEQQRSEYVCHEEFARSAKLCEECFDECISSAIDSRWVSLETDVMTGDLICIPAIGESNEE